MKNKRPLDSTTPMTNWVLHVTVAEYPDASECDNIYVGADLDEARRVATVFLIKMAEERIRAEVTVETWHNGVRYSTQKARARKSSTN